MPGTETAEEAVLATLARYAEHEQEESLNTATELLDALARGGLAVHGTTAPLGALRRGQVDVLVLSSAYEAPDGWACASCETADVGERPPACPCCGERTTRETSLKEHLVRLAEMLGVTIEIVRQSDVLFDIGGVGCLLRFGAPKQDESDRGSSGGE
jgi:peptide subunit release factor 1 (eRF1)